MRRELITGSLTAALLVLAATGAAGHPSFNPNKLPGGEATEVDFVIPHGCSASGQAPPAEGEDASGTTLVAVQVPEGIMAVEPLEAEGWELNVVTAGDAVTEWDWTASESAITTDPITFRVSVTPMQGDEGTEIHWPVFQECEQGSYQWIGTPDGDPDADPAALMQLTTGEAGTAEVDHGSHGEGEHGEGMAEGEHGQDKAEGEHGAGEHGEDMADGGHGDEMGEGDGILADEMAEAAADQGDADDDTMLVVILAILVLAVGLIVAGLTAKRRDT